MRSTGMTRRVDELGRVVIPVELRRALGISERDPLEIFVEKDMIVLRKYIPDVEKQSVAEALLQLDELTAEEKRDAIERAIRIIEKA